jgi:hypothetical protein
MAALHNRQPCACRPHCNCRQGSVRQHARREWFASRAVRAVTTCAPCNRLLLAAANILLSWIAPPQVWNVSDAAPEAAQAVHGSQAGVIQAGTLSKTDVGVLDTIDHSWHLRRRLVPAAVCSNPTPCCEHQQMHIVTCATHMRHTTAGTPGADGGAGAHAVLDEALRHCQGTDSSGHTKSRA